MGIIDGTLIRITSPPANHPVYSAQPYYFQKNYYTVNTQVIGDADRKILRIIARFPGSDHDSAIW